MVTTETPPSSPSNATSGSHSSPTSPSSRKRPPTKKQKPWVENGTSLIVLAVSTLIAFGGGRYIRTSIHEWVEPKLRNVMATDKSNNKKGPLSPRIWTVTPNSTGLKVDAAIYREFLGSEMSMLEEGPPLLSDTNNDNEEEGTSCVYIFLEVTPQTPNADMHKDWAQPNPNKNNKACRIMAMANTDQFTIDMFQVPNLELIICKTRQCVSWVQQKQQDLATEKEKIPILYTGFTSRPPVPPPEVTIDDEVRFQKFLHVAGQSPHKGTWTILQAWIQHPHWPPITITSYKNQMMDTVLQQLFQQLQIDKLPPNIHHIKTKLPLQELERLQYTHGVHLCLSGMEGFGHYLNEGRAVGALTLATNYPAMNEMITEETGILLAPTSMLEWTNGLPFGNVGGPELARVMNEVVLPMSIQERKERGQLARKAFDRDREQFQQRMLQFQCYINQCTGGDANKQHSCADECGLVLE